MWAEAGLFTSNLRGLSQKFPLKLFFSFPQKGGENGALNVMINHHLLSLDKSSAKNNQAPPSSQKSERGVGLRWRGELPYNVNQGHLFCPYSHCLT